MSVTSVINNLAAGFAGIGNPNYPFSGGPSLVVKSRPTVTINPEDFPVLILSYDWGRENDFELHQGGGIPLVGGGYSVNGHHKYWLAIHVFVGGKNAELEDLHARIEPWPGLLLQPIVNLITRNEDGIAIMAGEGTSILPYRIGYYPWGGVNDAYFGLKTSLWINEDI